MEYAFAEDPKRTYLDGAVFWRADADDSILQVTAHRRPIMDGSSPVDFRRISADVTVLKVDSGREHVRLSQDSHSINLEVEEGTILDGPVYLKFFVNFTTVQPQIVTLDRLYALCHLHKFRKKDFKPDQRRYRWLLALHAIDLEEAGLSQRQIADRLIDEAVGLKWREKGNALRSRVRRIIVLGRTLRDGGYFQLLSGRGEPQEDALLH